MTRGRTSSLSFWLLLLVAAATAYVSLYPFNLNPQTAHLSLIDAIGDLHWARAGRDDRLSNILLYIPFGFCALLAFENRWQGPTATLIGIALGALLSFTMEVTQTWIAERVASLLDLSLNTLGTAVGVVGGLCWIALSRLLRFPFAENSRRRDPSALLVILLWLLWRWAPFLPSLDLRKMKTVFKPLLSPELDVGTFAIYLLCWLAVSQAVFAFVTLERGLEALLALVAAVLIGRVLVDNQAFVPAEMLALLAMLPALVLLNRIHPTTRRVVLAVAMVGLLAFERLAPFNFSGPAQGLDLWPFIAWMHSGFSVGWIALFRQLFLYGSVLWLFKDAGTSVNFALAVLIAIVAITEVAQMWLPGHAASLTDPVIALAVGLAFREFDKRYAGPRPLRRASLR